MLRRLPHICLTILVAEMIVLSACGGGGHPHPISVTITNPSAPPTIQQGQTVSITAAVANDSNNQGVTWTLTGVGTLSGQTTTAATYNAPASVGSNTNVTVTATSVADNTKSATLTITVTPPPPITVTISSKITSIIAGAAAVNFGATVQNDSANAGVTWSLIANSTNCDPTCGSLSNVTTTSVTYTPPATVPASPNDAPTLVATSVTDNTKSDTDAFTIVSFASANNGDLKGQYAFLVGGFDDATGGQFAYIGSFTADGAGGVTSGIEDENLPTGVTQNLKIQGSYSLGADNRGVLTLSGGGGITRFAFSAGAANAGVATKLHIIEFDDSTGTNGRRGSGVAYLQDPTTFALSGVSGSYAVQLTGQANGTAGTRSTNVGQFTAASGAVTGTLDTNSNGSFSSGNAFAGTLTSGALTTSDGRLTYAVSSGGIGNAVVYIVSATRFLAMTVDPESTNGLISGAGVLQTSSSFTNASLNGAVVLYSTGLSSVAGRSYAQAGVLTFDSNTATGTIKIDTNDGGTAGPVSTTFTYSVAADGHVTINPAIGPAPDLYLQDTNKAFMIDDGSFVNAGLVDAQSAGPFSGATVSGNYFFGLAEYAAVTADGDSSGVVTSAGAGTANATVDASTASGALGAGQAQAITLTLADANLGRLTDNLGNVIYIVSPTEYVTIQASANDPNVKIYEQ